MGRLVAFGYGVAAYGVFLGAFLYAIGFVGNVVVPKGIDDGPVGDAASAVLIDLVLLGAFAVQHSVMARQAFKRWWTRVVPRPVERSTYVLIASCLLILLFICWRPLPMGVWRVEAGLGRLLLSALFWLGWLTVLLSTFMIDHFDLFGLRQVWCFLTGTPYEPPRFTMAGLYRYVRHPVMLGFLIAFWATPEMTVGHLLFAASTTAYILIGIFFEERDLARFHGRVYSDYRRRVPMLIPWPRKARSMKAGPGARWRTEGTS